MAMNTCQCAEVNRIYVRRVVPQNVNKMSPSTRFMPHIYHNRENMEIIKFIFLSCPFLAIPHVSPYFLKYAQSRNVLRQKLMQIKYLNPTWIVWRSTKSWTERINCERLKLSDYIISKITIWLIWSILESGDIILK